MDQRLLKPATMSDRDVAEDLRLLLIGETGSGKSATGNTIFNAGVFESEMSSSSVTRVCQTHTDAVHNRRVTVIDTPDFFSTHTDFDSDSELKRALSLCSPGAHVILLLLSLSTFTEQEMDFIAWFEQKFGEEALRFTLVLVTHADKADEMLLEEMIKGNTRLSKFINRCGGGFYGMNNKCPANRRQVTELMEKIDRLLSENTNSCYTLDMMLEIEKRREEEERRRKEEKEREHKMRLERVREVTEERVRREYEQEKRKRAEERKREHEMRLEIIKIETEMNVRGEYEAGKSEKHQLCKQMNLKYVLEVIIFYERIRIETEMNLRRGYEAAKRKKHQFFKQIKLKYVCVIVLFAVVTGGVLVWKKDSSHGWMFTKGFITGGSASTTGVFTGIFWRLFWKSALIRSSSHERPSAVRQLLLKTGGVVCGLSAGAVIGHFIGGNEVPVTVSAALAGAAGAFTAIL